MGWVVKGACGGYSIKGAYLPIFAATCLRQAIFTQTIKVLRRISA